MAWRSLTFHVKHPVSAFGIFIPAAFHVKHSSPPPGLGITVVRAPRLPKMLWLNQAGETPAPQT